MCVTDITRLSDGSGFFTLELPLPDDHWLFQAQETLEPPMPMRCGTDNPKRKNLENALREAGKYALLASITSPNEVGFDPDAFLQNLIVGMLGYHTPDGLSTL